MHPVLRWGGRALIAITLAMLVGYLPLRVFGGGGIERARMLQRQLSIVQERLAETRRDDEALRREARALKDDPRTIERVARDDLGMVRPGDLVFQFE